MEARLREALRGMRSRLVPTAAWTAGLALAWLLIDHHLDFGPLKTLTTHAAPQGLPLGIVLLGIVIGSLNGLVALGMVLIYRAQRVINFAQADVGGVGAVLAIELVQVHNWNYFAAVGAGLALAALIGGVSEFLIVRRFFRAPRLILTVATIGMQQLFGAIELFLPDYFKAPNRLRIFQTPFTSFSFRVPPASFNGDDLMVVLAVPVLLVALVAFFRYNRFGVAVRGSAENAERASLLGIPVKRLGTIVWVIAAVLAGVAAALRAPVTGAGIAGIAGSSLILRALAPAIIGRMENLWVTMLASLGLGVVEQFMIWNFSHASFVDPALLVVIMVALLVQRHGRDRALDTGMSTWKAVAEVRPVPTELRGLPEVRAAGGLAGVLLLAVLLAAPFFLRPAQLSLASGVLIYGIIACSLVILTGWAGQLSLGNMAIAGIGAAVTAQLYTTFGWDMFRAMVVGTATGALVALMVGIPALRIRGLFLGASTLALAVATGTVFLDPRFVPWLAPVGQFDRPVLFHRFDLAPERNFYYLCLVAVIFAVGLSFRLRGSQLGRTWIAVRDNERGARALAIDHTRARILAFAVSGALAAFGGSLFAFDIQSVPAGFFGGDTSLNLFVMVVLGGLGSIAGALFGAAYVRIAQIYIIGPAHLLVTGVGLLVVLLYLPGGLGSLLYGVRDAYLRWVARRRGLVVPSLNMDAATATSLEREILLKPVEVPAA